MSDDTAIIVETPASVAYCHAEKIREAVRSHDSSLIARSEPSRAATKLTNTYAEIR